MHKLLAAICLTSIGSVSFGQSLVDPVAIAEAQGVCAPAPVATATLDVEGVIRATCAEDATAFVPLLGGLAPVLGLGAAATAISALSGGNSTPDTQ